MAGAFPISSAGFQLLASRAYKIQLFLKSQSGKKLARQIDGQRFAFTAQIITGKRSDIYGELMAFIIKQRSQKKTLQSYHQK